MLIFAFVGWTFATLAIMAIFNSINLEYLFVLYLIGFILITMLSGPFTARPRWRSRANVVILAGVLVFFIMVINKALDILGIKLF
jgi:hypothetical protein